MRLLVKKKKHYLRNSADRKAQYEYGIHHFLLIGAWDRQIFSSSVFHLEQPHAQSLFLFLIVVWMILSDQDQWRLFIKMATDWEVSEVGDTCRPDAGPGSRRSVQIQRISAWTAHLGFPALLSVPHLLSREIMMNRRHSTADTTHFRIFKSSFRDIFVLKIAVQLI